MKKIVLEINDCPGNGINISIVALFIPSKVLRAASGRPLVLFQQC